MTNLILFPLTRRYTAQHAARGWPLPARLIAAGRWPWPSDGNAGRLVPPRGWRPFGSHLTSDHARGAGIWSVENVLRVQIGLDALEPTGPAEGQHHPGDFR